MELVASCKQKASQRLLSPQRNSKGQMLGFKGFPIVQTRAGSTKWIVKADQAQVFDQEQVARLKNVNVQLFDQAFKHEQMVITSQEGIMHTSSNDFELISHDEKTVMTFEDGSQVFTDKLTWKEEVRQIFADERVMIKGEGLVITGIGLVGDVEKNEFRLLNNVRAEVSSL